MEIKVAQVRNCARCGLNHGEVHFQKLENPITDTDGTVWDWWAMCPIKNEPILMKMEPKDSD